ncbi:hypothetical protein Hden_2996 [Hyphomicrobium denitrificans ATCC 51888]|uniref:Uncharacterized protein n=1 Tax=Hyphomicrobium denitrificans (strain ATCC 51888 / DSM 1869 / NCIMB 11706 / TK 0415) TaxID=582899 RepID=D8JVD7_HYPDA|nr:hypothetical protein [Hyphomicrobium denitrificans]ADJ24791.1 hypothetical protein Hden_2996 [Hyphomicrobium denitrificans ATCC 51888]
MSETPSKAVLRLQSSIKQLQILKGSATAGELAQSFALDIETHELALAEITSLRAQLDEARKLGGKLILDASRQLNEKDDEIKRAADEARRKAIEDVITAILEMPVIVGEPHDETQKIMLSSPPELIAEAAGNVTKNRAVKLIHALLSESKP